MDGEIMQKTLQGGGRARAGKLRGADCGAVPGGLHKEGAADHRPAVCRASG